MRSETEKKFFDIVPPKEKFFLRTNRGADFFRFAMTGFLVFAAFSLANVYVKGRAFIYENKDIAMAGVDTFQAGVGLLEKQDFEGAETLFRESRRAMETLATSVGALTSQSEGLFGEKMVMDTADRLVKSGLLITQMGEGLTALADTAKKLPEVFGNSEALISQVSKTREQLRALAGQAEEVQSNLNGLNGRFLPQNVKERISSAKQGADQVIGVLSRADGYFEAGLRLLGDRLPHQILILLQNKNERRATGGFIGSYLLVSMNDGRIAKMQAKDVYESDGQLPDEVPAPPGIDRVADRLYMRDANYSPDFPTSAERIMWFLEHSRGPSVDTVIAIDQTVAEKLLEQTGPLFVDGFPFKLTAKNVSDMLSYHTETKVAGIKNPKQLLFGLVGAVKEKLMASADKTELLSLAQGLVREGHIQVYSQDVFIEKVADDLGAAGRMVAPAPKTDYLNVVSTSIGGNKSDRFIKTEFLHRTEIGADGSIVNALAITKNHTWREADWRRWKRLKDYYGTGTLSEETLRFILGEGPNVDYMRVYVPQGSRLMRITGVASDEIRAYDELGYTVFAFPFGAVAAGEEKTVSLDYALPFAVEAPVDDYRLVAQRQAGAGNVMLKKEIAVADRLEIVSVYPESQSAFSLAPVYEMPLNENRVFMTSVKSLTAF